MKIRFPSANISALLLSTALMIAVALPLQGQTADSYVPALRASDGADLGIALVNPTLTEAKVTLTARSYSGAIIQSDGITNPVTLTLAASGQIALRAPELFGTGISGQAGWVQISASTPAVKGFFLAFDSGLTFIDGAEFARPASRLVFPKVSAAGDSPTELSLVNTASQDMQGTLSLYRNDGQLFATRRILIPALSGFTSSIDELAPSATDFEGYAVVDSGLSADSGMSESLIGFETYRNRSDIALIRAFPESARLRTGFLAHLASQAGYLTTLTLVNFSNDSQVLRITADGLQVGGSPRTPSSVTVERTLAPNARLEERVDQMFTLSGEALIDGYIRFETQTDTSGVIAFLDYGTTDGIVLSAVEAQGEGYSNLFFSQVAEGAGYYTGLALLNPNSEPSIVTLDTFDAGGVRTGSTIVNLDSGERKARLLSEFLQRQVDQLGGYIRLTATRPIFAFELFGSRDSLTFLASVPAQGESLKPQASGRMVDASQGANVISSDGSTSLLIPPKALNSNAPIKVAPISVADLPLPTPDQQPIAAVEATPAGTQFQIPVRLTFSVNADLDPGTQIPLLIFDPLTRKYQPTEFVATVDKSGRTASAEVTHFTQYVGSLATTGVTISNINPSTVSIGDTITISGTGFSTNKQQTAVTFAGANSTSIQGAVLTASTTSIQAVVPVGAVTGPVIVRAFKNGTSTGYAITVLGSPNPAPGTISISPSTAVVGTPSVDVQIAGTAFVSNSVVKYDGNSIPATFVDQTLLKVTLGSLSTVAIHHINVVNPAPGGGTSNTVDFTVTNTPTSGALSIVTPLTLDKTVVIAGQTLNATATYKNTGGSAVTVNSIAMGGRPPGGTNAGGPYDDLSPQLGVTTVQPGATFQVLASRAFTSTDPTGAWYSFVTYQDASSAWHDGPSVNFTVSAPSATNQPPAVNAGSNQSITLPAAATLNGTVTDDGLPAGSTLTQTWSKFSGVGTVTFGNATSWSTVASFSTAGSYILRLTASDGALSSSADVTITVNPVSTTNQPPVVNAGPDQTITLPASASLNGTATDDGLPTGSVLTKTWSKVSGPGTVTFGNINALSTTASFSTSGSYVLRLTASDTALSSSNDITIVVNLAAPSSSLLAAYAFDEGSGNLTSTTSGNAATLHNASWTTGKFGNAVSFNGSSSYVEDPAISALTPGATATFEAWVYLRSTPTELVSVLNKWSQTADDEYLLGINPDGTTFFAWQTTGGGAYGGSSYSDVGGATAIALNTLTHIAVVRNGANITFYVNGTPDISLNVMDTNPFRTGINSLRIGGQGRGGVNRYIDGNIDEVRIYNRALTQAEIQSDMSTPVGTPTNRAPAVSAGSGQTITMPNSASLNGTATDDGLPVGSVLKTTWSKVSGPGTVTSANVNALSTTASFSIAGSYVLQLAATDGALTSSSSVTITVNAAGVNQAPTVNAGPDQTITLPASATLSGTASDDGLPTGSTLTTTWSKVSGPGTITFGNVNAKSTTASFSTSGTYVLRLTASDSALSSTDDVNIVVKASSGSLPGLTDTATHLPPSSGLYAYNSFKPGTTGFPTLGQTYVDPVFGSTIRRITADYPKQTETQIYSANGWWNADSTLFVHRAAGAYRAINATTGALVSVLPTSSLIYDNSFDPVNPSIWYYFSGSSIRQYNVTTGADALVKTFPATLESLGGSADWIDRTGRYWLVVYSGAAHIWDKQTNTIYSGSVNVSGIGGGWVGITPSGNNIVISTTWDHWSYGINHATQTLSSSGKLFWSLCGDHGDVISPTDGKDYFITSECWDVGAVYRVDITIAQDNSTDAGRQKQRDDNVMLLATGFNSAGGPEHYTCASKGTNQNWCYVSVELTDDQFDNQGPWSSFKQEIIAFQLVSPYTVRRLAHHRSRQLNCPSCASGGYEYSPRPSASWDGLKVAWASNFDYNGSPAEYADIYVIETPQLAESTPLVSPSYQLAMADLTNGNTSPKFPQAAGATTGF